MGPYVQDPMPNHSTITEQYFVEFNPYKTQKLRVHRNLPVPAPNPLNSPLFCVAAVFVPNRLPPAVVVVPKPGLVPPNRVLPTQKLREVEGIANDTIAEV